jgi:hypothetical protein
MSESIDTRRRTLLAGASAVAAIGVPALSRAQADVIRIGHLTPRTGFLGPLGEFAVQAADMAVAEINAAGGVGGRKIELLKEDSVNPQTASTKAERMIERDKVAASSARSPRLRASRSARSPSARERCSSTPAATPMSCAARVARSTCSTSRARTRCT